jgi:hypothetical protein
MGGRKVILVASRLSYADSSVVQSIKHNVGEAKVQQLAEHDLDVRRATFYTDSVR